MRGFLNFLGGAYELTRLAALSRFRFRGPYWQWRMHTAFGKGLPKSRVELVRSILAYGSWMHRMRKGRV